MTGPPSTCWNVLQGAADGNADALEEFAKTYSPILRAYFTARWRGSPMQADMEDAVQEVFVDFFKEGGALARLDSGRTGRFRPFLFGVARNVALRCETRRARRRERHGGLQSDLLADEESVPTVFLRAWAHHLVERAAADHALAAAEQGPDAQRRVELLCLRFYDGHAIREIADLWNEDPARLHREYRKARKEYRDALLRVLALQSPAATPAELERRGETILSCL